MKTIIKRIRNFLFDKIRDELSRSLACDQVSQIQLMMTYQTLVNQCQKLPSFKDVGFRISSQADEDGILHFIFSIIGTDNKKCVEICAGDGIECNAANLIINHGWSGLLIDGNESLVKKGQQFYIRNRNTYVYPPVLKHTWITKNNVNDIIKSSGFEGDIDLLSLDMDGVDYWIWDAIDVINPRVVVVEYQDILGPEKSLTVPYQDDFNAWKYPTTNGMPNFCGASLPAYVKLAKKKGYRLVGCNRYGYNAFFIKNGVGEKIVEIPIAECFQHPKVIRGMSERFPTVKDYQWVEV